MENMELYNAVRQVPDTAKKPIGAGRLKGMTDINPQWRLEVLTKTFGACGIGWYYEVSNKWTEVVGNEVCAFVDINLYIKTGEEWSKPIYGSGGSKLATIQKGEVYVSDECYKMATTDAISVACKQLGIGADVYWQKGAEETKYSSYNGMQSQAPALATPKDLEEICKAHNISPDAMAKANGIEGIANANEAQIDAMVRTLKMKFGE